MTPQRIVLFDLDGTLTWVDTLPFFLAWALAFRPWRVLVAAAAVPALVRFSAGSGTAVAAKEALLRAAVAGLELVRARRIAALFVRWVLPALERRTLVRRLLAHRAAGDAVWIVSASPDLVCGPLAARWGIDGAMATRLQVLDGRLTGRLDGPNCAGAEKVVRVRAVLGERTEMVSIVYGDDPQRDGPLWALAQVPVRVPGPLPAFSSLPHPGGS